MSYSKQVDDLAALLKKYSDAYYNDAPLVSDTEFDHLRDQLKQLAPDHPLLKSVGAPVASSIWPKRAHSRLMGSLDKANTEEEFNKWAADKGEKFVVTEKADGCTLVATYDQGVLTAITTRGDGKIGEDITSNGILLKNVVRSINEDFTGEIRGEAILRRSVFEKYFAPLGYMNPRNAANGKLRDQKDTSLIRHIEVMWFDIIVHYFDEDIETEVDKFKFFKKWGLKHSAGVLTSKNRVWKVYQEYQDGKRASLDYEIDGLVVKMANIAQQEALGVVGGCPRGAIALKFPPPAKETTLLGVEWERGLTGRFTPVAIVQPVDLGGVTVKQCSIHNLDHIKRLGISIGDKVIIQRNNDVIPQIAKRIGPGDNTSPIEAPTQCTVCAGKLTNEGAYLVCANDDCQGVTYGTLMTWIKEVKIMGIGPAVLRDLISYGITDAAKLYTASEQDFIRATDSEKIGSKLHNNVQATKQIPLNVVLSGLAIPSLGTTNGERIAQHFGSLANVLLATETDIGSIPGIKTNAVKIFAGLQAKRDLLISLSKILEIQEPKKPVVGGKLSGMSFCMTGALSKKREDIEAWIESLGGEVKSKVTKGLTYLVTNTPESGTGKNKDADKLGVKKITEAQLYELGNV